MFIAISNDKLCVLLYISPFSSSILDNHKVFHITDKCCSAKSVCRCGGCGVSMEGSVLFAFFTTVESVNDLCHALCPSQPT